MGAIVSNALRMEKLNQIINVAMTLRIFGNNVIPNAVLDTAISYNEISGGGYSNRPLASSGWTVTPGNPATAVFESTQEWTFTGAVDAPGSIYGYYITRNTDGMLVLAERFPSGLVPFEPEDGSVIRVLPKIVIASLF